MAGRRTLVRTAFGADVLGTAKALRYAGDTFLAEAREQTKKRIVQPLVQGSKAAASTPRERRLAGSLRTTSQVIPTLAAGSFQRFSEHGHSTYNDVFGGEAFGADREHVALVRASVRGSYGSEEQAGEAGVPWFRYDPATGVGRRRTEYERHTQRQFRPYKGSEGYWIWPTVRSRWPHVIDEWQAIADEIIGRAWAGRNARSGGFA